MSNGNFPSFWCCVSLDIGEVDWWSCIRIPTLPVSSAISLTGTPTATVVCLPNKERENARQTPSQTVAIFTGCIHVAMPARCTGVLTPWPTLVQLTPSQKPQKCFSDLSLWIKQQWRIMREKLKKNAEIVLFMHPVMNDGVWEEHVVNPCVWDGCYSWKKRSGRLWQWPPKWCNSTTRWLILYPAGTCRHFALVNKSSTYLLEICLTTKVSKDTNYKYVKLNLEGNLNKVIQKTSDFHLMVKYGAAKITWVKSWVKILDILFFFQLAFH